MRPGRPSLFAAALVAGLALACVAAPSTRTARADEAGDALAESYKLHAAGDLAGATRAMRAAVEAAPRAYFPRARLAYLFTLAGEWASAADAYRAAAAIEPAAVEPLLGRQYALVVLERWDEAEKVGRDVLSRDAKSYLGLSRLAWTLYVKKDLRGAVEAYAKVVALYPGDLDMRVGLAASLLGLGKKAEAAAGYREVLAMYPGHATATAGLAACGKQ